MKSKRTPEFREHLHALPPNVRQQTYKAYRQFKADPSYPSLQFKQIRGDLYSIRVGLRYRALGKRSAEDEIT